MAGDLVRIRQASAFIPGDKQRRLVLRDIDWNVAQGTACAVLGPNGSGKSSLLRLLQGSLRPCAGHIEWLDKGRFSASPISARQITALVAPEIQAFCQIHGWDVTGLNLVAGAASDSSLASRQEPDARTLADIESLMASLEAEELLAMPLSRFSQGQLRLVLLARALLARPALLLLDEWAEGLDAEKRRLAQEELARRAGKMAMIFTSHRKEGLPAWIGERLYMRAGRLCRDAPAEEPEPARAQAAALPARPAEGQTLVELENVSVYVERNPVLHNLCWRLKTGEHWRISGPNGSGKSTFLRLLAGDEMPALGGRLEIRSPKLGRRLNTLEEKRHAVSLVSDLGQAVYGYDVSALELVLSGCDNSIGIYRQFSPGECGRAERILAFCFPGDDGIGQVSIRRLSSGQLRRLFLARALMAEPEILLLDEPCTGLDAQSRSQWLEFLGRLAAKGGKGPQIVVASHYEDDFPAFLNRRARMDKGRLIVEDMR